MYLFVPQMSPTLWSLILSLTLTSILLIKTMTFFEKKNNN